MKLTIGQIVKMTMTGLTERQITRVEKILAEPEAEEIRTRLKKKEKKIKKKRGRPTKKERSISYEIRRLIRESKEPLTAVEIKTGLQKQGKKVGNEGIWARLSEIEKRTPDIFKYRYENEKTGKVIYHYGGLDTRFPRDKMVKE